MTMTDEHARRTELVRRRTAVLFQPVRAGPLTLANRIVMAPMTRSLAPDGVPGPDNASYYRRRAAGGVGLIITEGTWVPHPSAGNEEHVPRMYGEDALQGWAGIVREVHDEGVPILAQLWHVGQIKRPVIEGLFPAKEGAPEPRRIGPSGWFGGMGSDLSLDGAPATLAELDAVRDAFRQGALNARRAGFDGIEIHGAHGYLFDQFFWSQTNRRTDRYGGSIANRVRFAAETVAAIRDATGPDFVILFRLSQWRLQDFTSTIFSTPSELEAFTLPLATAGVDVFHCSQRRYWDTEFGSDLNLAGWTRKLTGKPAISVGSVAMSSEHIETLLGKESHFAGINRLLKMVERGDFDLVAVGRGLLADPRWAEKVRAGHLDQLLPWNPAALESLN
jgi:2,4-dienoyl-CoA reductase-like NADH-dependent reductase (Old Yellow Enzyme family)